MLKRYLPFFLLVAPVLLSGCYKLRGTYGTKNYEAVARPVNVGDIKLPDGYQIEPVCTGLTFPTDMTFDDKGNIYVIEAGYSYGEIFTEPRLLKVDAKGSVTEIAKGGKNGPWTAVDFHDGNFYVAEGGVVEGGKILRFDMTGKMTVLAEGLPGYGDHHTNAVRVGDDGYIYFGQGTATNSGVVGNDNHRFGWLARKRDFHDIPCEDVVLAGVNYTTENALSAEKEKIETGAFVPYGTKTVKGQVIKGQLPCTGAVMRLPLKGGPLELVAWGFRNPYGLSFAPDGSLFVTENGFDTRGSRPVFGAGDLMWKVESKKWYGWPDYAGDDSLSSEHYKARKIRPQSLLLKDPNKVPKPTAMFGVHSSANLFDFSRSAAFGYEGQAFVAQFGDMAPDVGTIYGPVGFKVVRVNTSTGEIADFVVNKGEMNGPASTQKSGGVERPNSVRFSPDGKEMYIVDFGVLEVTDDGAAPKKKTGMIWKVTKK